MTRYANSMAQYMKANNLTPENITQEQLAKADEYAFNEALKATYNDYNVVADYLNKLSQKSNKARFFKDAIVPFTTTPFNIVRRGVRYSPIGLAETITKGTNDLSKGKITANEFIDNLSAGLTGSGIFALGALLTSLGIFRTKDDDKDRKQRFDEALGEQDYAIKVGDGSFTLDWAEPVIMPLAMGAEMYNALSALGNADEFDVMNAITSVSSKVMDPIIETSMLSGLQSSLKSYSQSGGEYFGDIIANAVASYVNQFFPTIGGQIARTIDDTRRTTYPNTGLVDKTIRQIENKIPGLSQLNQPYINYQGEEQKSEDLGMGAVGRLLTNMVLPGYYSRDNSDEYSDELYRLYEQTGDISVFPSSSTTKVTNDNVDYKLYNEDYTEYQKQKYQAEDTMVREFIDSNLYANLDDSQRVAVIEGIRKYANFQAKDSYLDTQDVSFDSAEYRNMQTAINNGVSLPEYLISKDVYKNLSGDTKKTDYVDYLNSTDLSPEAKNYMYDVEYGGSKFSSYVNDLSTSDENKLAIKELKSQYSKSEDFAQALSNAGLLDQLVEYAKDNNLEYSDVGLSKKAVARYYYGNTNVKFDSDTSSASKTNNTGSLDSLLSQINGGSSKTTTQSYAPTQSTNSGLDDLIASLNQR